MSDDIAAGSDEARDGFRREVELAAFEVGHDVEAAADRAERVARWAARVGDDALLQRARMVIADAAGRRGRTADLGIAARAVLAWGLEQGDGFVVARAHRLLSTFYDVLGDGGTALEHAVAAVELLPTDVSSFFRGDHETRLGTAHIALESFGPARERFTRLLRWAAEIEDDNLRLRSLNNLAFLEYADGNAEEAIALSKEMIAHSRHSGIRLSAAAWDTVARTQMSGGDYAGAETTLLNTLVASHSITEAGDIADLHVTVATCQRLLGRFEDAAASLDVAQAQCVERELHSSLVDLIEERSQLAAATGDFERAYELHREFHGLKLEQLSAAKDARARILAAVFETDEAVRVGQRYREMSEHDHLTGLYNRRYAEDAMPQLLQSAARDDGHLSVAIADLDHFKRINDTCSHQVGDTVLQRFSYLLQAACPPGALAVRLGGEEFLLVLPGHDEVAARRVCEGLRLIVSQHDWRDLVGELPVTVSVGISTVVGRRSTFSELLAEADGHLYQAKRSGRDRVLDRFTADVAPAVEVVERQSPVPLPRT